MLFICEICYGLYLTCASVSAIYTDLFYLCIRPVSD